jgi:hypothetical protein
METPHCAICDNPLQSWENGRAVTSFHTFHMHPQSSVRAHLQCLIDRGDKRAAYVCDSCSRVITDGFQVIIDKIRKVTRAQT